MTTAFSVKKKKNVSLRVPIDQLLVCLNKRIHLQQKAVLLQRYQTLGNIPPWRSGHVKLAGKLTKMIWHAWARVCKTWIIQFSLSCLFFHLVLSYSSFSPCVWSSLVLPSFRSDPSLFSSLLTLLLLLFSTPGLEGCWPVSWCFLSFCRQFSQPLFPVSPSASRCLPFLSFSCGSLGSHALRLYRCLWERRRPAVNN